MNSRKIFSNVFIFLGIFVALYAFVLLSAGEVSAQTCGGGGYYNYEEYHCTNTGAGSLCTKNTGSRYLSCTVQVGRCQRVFFMRTRTCTVGKLFASSSDCWYSGDGSVTNMTQLGCGWTDPPPDWTPPPVVSGGCNFACTSNANCNGGYTCAGGYCKNSLCTTDADCICGGFDPPPGDGTCNASCSSNGDCTDNRVCYNGQCRKGACQSDSDCNCDKCAISNATAAIVTRYDTNDDGEIQDSDEPIQGTNSGSCGSYRTVSDFILQQSGGDGNIQAPVHNNCSYYGGTIPNAQWRPIQGGGDNRFSGSIWLAGVPAGYKVLKAQGGGCTWDDDSKRLVNCSWCGKKNLDFLVTDAQPNWCDISVTPSTQYAAPGTVTVRLRGRANTMSSDPVNSPTVKVWFSRIDGTRIPNDDITPDAAMYRDPTYGNYFYSIKSAGCNSQNQSLCTKTTDVTIPAADYYVHCDVGTQPEKCSGNPTCTYEAGGYRPCSGWQSCSGADNTTVEVHLPCVTGIKSPVCTNNGTSVTLGFTGGFNSSNANQYRFDYGGSRQTRTTSGDVTFPTPSDQDVSWYIQARRPYEPAPWTGEQCGGVNNCAGTSCDIDLVPVLNAVGGGVNIERNHEQDFNVSYSSAAPYVVPTGIRFSVLGGGVDFDPSVPFTDGVFPFEVTAKATGAINSIARLTATPYFGGEVCGPDDFTNILITETGAWWQVEDADVWSSGVINSDIPPALVDTYFDEIPSPLLYSPGYPGVPVFGNSTNIPPSLMSELPYQWNANSWTVYSVPDLGKQFTYEGHFLKNLPNEIGTALEGGNVNTDPVGHVDLSYFNNNDGYNEVGDDYYYFLHEGNLTIDDGATINQGRKIILFVNGNITFAGSGVGEQYSVGGNAGNALFMVIASGDITVSPDVARLDGIFVTDKTFSTGTYGLVPADDDELTVNGSVVAWNGVNLDRDLGGNGNAINPSEKFRYKPQMFLTIPSFFGIQTMKWREVAP